jgi:hypothetical protein
MMSARVTSRFKISATGLALCYFHIIAIENFDVNDTYIAIVPQNIKRSVEASTLGRQWH